MSDIRVRFDSDGGGATVSVDGKSETYTYPLGNVASMYGTTLALLGDDSGIDGYEAVYRERLAAELAAAIKRYGLIIALWQVFSLDIKGE